MNQNRTIVSADAKVKVVYERRTFLGGIFKWWKEERVDVGGYDIHINEIDTEPYRSRVERVYLNGVQIK